MPQTITDEIIRMTDIESWRLTSSPRASRILNHYERIWTDSHIKAQWHFNRLVSEALRNLCGDNGSGQRTEVRL